MAKSMSFASNAFLVLGILATATACDGGSRGATPSADAAPTDEARARAYHMPAGTGPAVWGPGDVYTLLATGKDTGEAYFQFEAVVPGGGGPPPHIHHREDESFYLVKGELEIRLGDRTVLAKSGDFVNIPKGTAHSFKNVGNDTATMLITFVPAGFEKYFEEVFPRADRSKSPPPTTPELIERMKAAATKHHLEFVRAAPTPSAK